MSDDTQEDQTDRSQQNIHNPHRVGQIDPSFRNDKHYVGLNTALVLLVTSGLIYVSDLYSSIIAGSVFVLAILLAVISFPYDSFQEE